MGPSRTAADRYPSRQLAAAAEVAERLRGADVAGAGEEVLPHLAARLDPGSARQVVEALVERPDDALDAQSVEPADAVLGFRVLHVRLLPVALRGGDEQSCAPTTAGEGHPVGGARGQGVAAGGGRPVVLARRAGVRRDEPRADAALSLEPGEGRVDRAFEDAGQPDLVQPLDELVAVGLALGEQVQQEEGEDALQQLGVVVGAHGARLCLLLDYVKYNNQGQKRVREHRATVQKPP